MTHYSKILSVIVLLMPVHTMAAPYEMNSSAPLRIEVSVDVSADANVEANCGPGDENSPECQMSLQELQQADGVTENVPADQWSQVSRETLPDGTESVIISL